MFCYRELLAPEGSILLEGDMLKRPLLAETLRNIADNGANYFYEGAFMEQMVSELQANGAIINASDFMDYSVEERLVTRAFYDKYDVLGISTPGGGSVLGLILNILDGITPTVHINAQLINIAIISEQVTCTALDILSTYKCCIDQ